MRWPITNFSRGEFAPELYGRVDIPQYSSGAKELTNFFVQRYGGVSFRPGFRFVGEVANPALQYRYVPFIFSNEQAYVINFGDTDLRLLAGGGFVTEDDQQILGAVYGYTTVLNIAYHGTAVGDRVYIDGTNVPGLNGRFTTVIAVPDASHVTVDINSNDTNCFPALTTSTGASHTGAPTPPPAPPSTPATPAAPPASPITTGTDTSDGPGTYTPDRHGKVYTS